MQRWNETLECYADVDKIDAFLKDILEVCKKHGLCISHEDKHGTFLIKEHNELDISWLANADDETGVAKRT